MMLEPIDCDSDPLAVLLRREDDALEADTLESAYLAGTFVRRGERNRDEGPSDLLGAAPYEIDMRENMTRMWLDDA